MTARATLAAVLALALATPVAATPGDGLTGAEVQALVADALAGAGQGGAPAIAAARPLPACAHWPEVRPAAAGDWRTVTLACADPGWTRHLRTGAAAPAPAATPALSPAPDTGPAEGGGAAFVLTGSLARGTVIAAHHIAPAPAAAGAPGAVGDPAALIGRRLAVNLGAGRLVLARHLEAQWLVTAGTPVVIAAEAAGYSISMAGEALDNGQEGDRVTVRNAVSGRIVTARVTGRDRVQVTPNMN